MENEESSFGATNEAYKIWKKHCPFLYSLLQSYELPSCAPTLAFFPHPYPDNDWNIATLLLGSNSLTANALALLPLALPTDHTPADHSHYRDALPDPRPPHHAALSTFGLHPYTPKLTIPQASEVMRARISPHDDNLVAVKTGGTSPELVLYDLRNKEAELEENSAKLEGHTEEGMGLAWSPTVAGRLLSGSYDRKILIWEVERGRVGELWESGEPVEDVKWAQTDSNLFCSAEQQGKIHLWDIRDSQRRPTLTRKAHNGDAYSVDFNPYTPHLLLSAGQDGDACLWDIRNISKKLHSFAGHSDSINVVAWNPHRPLQFATGSSDKRVVLWDMAKLGENSGEKTGNEILFIHGGHRSKVVELSWSSELDLLASSEENSTLHVWRPNERIHQ